MRIEIDVEKRLGAFHLKAALSCDTAVTALFGRSGSGKSTVLNLVAGLLRPDRGRIAVGERVLFDSDSATDIPPDGRRIGYVFQDGLLLPHLSVRQNLTYGRFFTPAAERWADFERIVALLDLAPLLERRSHHLSGGEKQRAAIGRALLASPRLLLMDEPLASVDANRKGEILYYIERLRDELHLPILYVSHAIEEVVRLADRVVVLANGSVAAAGTVQETIGRDHGGAVIEAKVVAQDLQSGLARLAFAGGELLVPDVEALIGETLRVHVRARDVSIALDRPRDISVLNCLRGHILEIGGDAGTSVDVRIDISGTPIVARITRHSAERLGLAVGKDVWAMVKAVSLDRRSVGYA